MEIDITQMILDSDTMCTLSGSVAELGENAGTITWNNSKEYAKEHPLLSNQEEINEAKQYLESFGAWEDKEIATWSDLDVQALIIQFIAGNIRESEAYDNEEDWIEAMREGKVCGSIFIYEGVEKKYYAYIGM